MTLRALLASLTLLLPLPVLAADPVLLVSVKPLQWLVQSLAPAGSLVAVLVPDGQSPHDYQLKPADIVRIRQSSLLVWVGPGLEPWLVQLASGQPAAGQLALLPHGEHVHGDEDAHGEPSDDRHGEEAGDLQQAIDNDPHLWLDPLALRDQAGPLAARLKSLYPAQAAEIDQRTAQFQRDMVALDGELQGLFAPVQQRGFVVYHDGYQRLVQRYHLTQRAAVWHHESIPAGARERAALLALLQGGAVQCLFFEPEHGADAVAGWLGAAAGKVRLVELDPPGQQTGAGPDSYPRFLRGLAARMVACLR